MLTDDWGYANIKESKPLWDKLKLVMIKIIEKLLNTLREQQKDLDIDKLKSDGTLFDLATQLAQIAVWNETVALQIEKDVLDQLSEDFSKTKMLNNFTELAQLKIKEHLETKTNYYSDVAREVGSDRAPKIFLFHPKFRHLMG